MLRRLAHPDADDPADGPLASWSRPIRAVLQPLVKGLGELAPVDLARGRRAPSSRTSSSALAAAAYTRIDLVERRGEFAVRGGILDVFPPTEEHPRPGRVLGRHGRGDPLVQGRRPALASRSPAHGLWAPPCRELLLTDDVRERAPRRSPTQLPGVADMLGKIAEGIAVEGMESLAPVLVDDMELLLDVLPAGTHVVLCDPERVRTRAHDLVATSAEFLEASWANAAAGNAVPVDLQRDPRQRVVLGAWPTSAGTR